MVAPSRTDGKTPVGILPDPGLLSPPAAPAAPTAGLGPNAQWVDPMRAVFLDFDEAEQEQRAAAAARGPATAPHAGAAALWHAMPLLVRVMFALDLLMGVLYFVSRRARNVIGKPLTNFFDLNGETNFPSWYSAAQ